MLKLVRGNAKQIKNMCTDSACDYGHSIKLKLFSQIKMFRLENLFISRLICRRKTKSKKK